MSIAEFVSHLQSLDVRLSAEGERLRLNAPKGVLTDQLRAEIAERKQELLEFLRANGDGTASNPPPIARSMGGNPAPLSFAQERLWFLEQLEPGSAVYNICRAYRLTGNLNLGALESSLNEIVRRHEVLRSSIRIADGQPVQVIEQPFELNLSVIDLRASSNVEREQKIRHRIQQAAEAPFDFAVGNFLRAELLRVTDDEHVLILATHHIASDAWSMGILTRELWSLYETYTAGKSLPLEELPLQYADFAVWQRDRLREEVLESQLSYWKEQLNDLPILNLPTDRPYLPRQSFRGARVPITLAKALSSAINELSGLCGVTPFMTLLSAFQVLLYRYSGQEDVVVGSPIANRGPPELNLLIGFFVNTLVLRSDLSGNPRFKELVARVREVCLGAYAHQDLPFEKLVLELKPERDQTRNPLFQVMFALQNATRPLSGVFGLRIEPLEIQSTRSPFDLSLFIRERDGKYVGYIEYSTDLFNRDRIKRMAGHFQTLLEGIIADPEQSISTLPILTDSERRQILFEWNETAADYPSDRCIHELFEEQVDRTPDAIAAQFEGKQLTYRELNSLANQLARYLQGLGVGPEKLVGICVERSLEMVVGLLGILKAGGAYVPLDPAYPTERLEFMLKDAQVAVLITQVKLIEDRRWKPVLTETEEMGNVGPRSPVPSTKPRTGLGPRLVCLDRDRNKIAQQSEENPEQGTTEQNLAYVIYTSGSTGTPKGVAIEHRNTVNLLQWAKTVYGPSELAGVLASTSICFDLSVFEMFLPLCCGGRVILVENALSLDGTLERSGITLINTVPSVMMELLRAGALPKSVRTVNLAGELLGTELVKLIYDLGHIERVYDLYGPSETTTYSTFMLRSSDGPPSIGRPISNTRVYILDSHLQPFPIGVCGEIYIGGTGVARGYLNRPELTSERFIPHPFSDDPADRLYGTGDLARYRPDGNIEFLGRTDNQVKIRGYRIEIGEIEAALQHHPLLKESVIVAQDRDSSWEKSLIAYFVPKERFVAISGLRNFLRDKLPDYMVPSLFVQLDALPLSPNGKIDRIALRLRDDARPELKPAYVDPRTQVEEQLTQIWEDVLKIEAVGINDNFFELGGHSLLAIQIISRVREAFDKDVPLSALFDTPTIAELAVTIEKTISGKSNGLPPITRASRGGPLPLSMNQEHLWRLDRMIPGTHFFNMPYVYRWSGNLNIHALEKALQEIIRRHEALRTVFADVAGDPVQIIGEPSDIRLPYIDLYEESEEEVFPKAADWILKSRRGPFDLQSGPLIRVRLLHLTGANYLLLVVIHHITSDHWSMEIFRHELNVLYAAFSQGQSSPLPKPTMQFADYAFWERKLITGGILSTQRKYWERKLLHSGQASRSVHKGIRKPSANFVREHQSLVIDGFLFNELKSFAVRRNVTPFVVVLSTLYALMHLYTGQRDLRIGVLVANRRWRGAESAIGHFVNTVVLPIHVSVGMTFDDLLEVTRDGVVSIQDNQEFPFEALAHTIERESGLKREALFEVLVAYNASNPTDHLAGPGFAPLELRDARLRENITVTAVDIIFGFLESSTQLTGSVNYRKGLFKRSSRDWVNEHLALLMETVLLRASAPISAVFVNR